MKGHLFGGRHSSEGVVRKAGHGPAGQIWSNHSGFNSVADGQLAHSAPHFGVGGLDTVATEAAGHSRRLRPRAPLSFLERRLFQPYFMHRKSDYLKPEY